MSEYGRTDEVINDHVGQTLLDAHCWQFVRNLHLLQHPSLYQEAFEETDDTTIDISFYEFEYPYKKIAASNDRTMLNTETAYLQKASWMSDDINKYFVFMQQTYGLDTPCSWREYILSKALDDNDESYKDEQGNVINPVDIMPNATTWEKLFTPAKRLSPARFAQWLSRTGCTEI